MPIETNHRRARRKRHAPGGTTGEEGFHMPGVSHLVHFRQTITRNGLWIDLRLPPAEFFKGSLGHFHAFASPSFHLGLEHIGRAFETNLHSATAAKPIVDPRGGEQLFAERWPAGMAQRPQPLFGSERKLQVPRRQYARPRPG